MKCRSQPCACHSTRYRCRYKGFHFLVLSGVECRTCHQIYPVRTLLKGMSLPYVDAMGKIVFLLAAVYYAILNFIPGVIAMLAMIILMNRVFVPVLFRFGILRIGNEVNL